MRSNKRLMCAGMFMLLSFSAFGLAGPVADAGEDQSAYVNLMPSPDGPRTDFVYVTLDASGSFSSMAEVTEYIWDFGDGTTGHGKVVDHPYKPGKYTATLVVKDRLGRVDMDTVNVHIDAAY